MSGRTARARPKRGGEDFARNHYHEVDGRSSPKKPRFDTRNPVALAPDATEDDVVLDADEIGRRRAPVKRNAVNIDGYESDSSNEGFDARVAAKANAAGSSATKSKDEEQDDMFADLEEAEFPDGDQDEVKDGKKKKKSVKFVDVDEIEGQVAGSKSGGHVSADFALPAQGHASIREQIDEEVESSTDSEVADEERAALDDDVDEEIGAGGKKKHAPKLDAFNLKNEKEEGGYDEQLNYVRKAADPDAVYDSWLEGISKKEMKKAQQAKKERDQDRRDKDRAEDAILTGDILKDLISLLKPGENALEALARFGRTMEKKTKRHAKTKVKKSQDMDVDGKPTEEEARDAKRREAVEQVTVAADLLLKRGKVDIYDADRELLRRMYKTETGEEWVERDRDGQPISNKAHLWEYRWADARDGGDVHGPYDSATMIDWQDAGYFGEGVEFRQTGNDQAEWESFVEF